MWAKQSSSSLLTSICRPIGTSSSVWIVSNPPTLLCAKLESVIAKIFRSPYTKRTTTTALEWWPICFLPEVNPMEAPADHLIATENYPGVMKNSSSLIILHISHRYAAADISQKTSEHPCTAAHIYMHLIMRRGGAGIRHPVSIKVSKFLHTSSALVLCHSSLDDTMKALVKLAGSLDLDYGVTLVNAPRKRYCQWIPVVWIPTTITRGNYVENIRLGNLWIEESALLPLLDRLSTKVGKGTNLSISHSQLLVMYSCQPDKVKLMSVVTDHINPTKEHAFPCSSRLIWPWIYVCKAAQASHGVCYRGPSFLPVVHFRDPVGPVWFLLNSSTVVSNNMCLFNFDHRNKNQGLEEKAEKHEKLLSQDCKNRSSGSLVLLHPLLLFSANTFPRWI